MAGLYIHIPFCSSRCLYCGFFSTTMLGERQRYVDDVCREMELRSLSQPPSTEKYSLDTIYLGGGTPSQLSAEQLHQLFDAIYNIYNVKDEAEVTIECNPDDVSDAFACMLRQLPVNRVSMGAQTFNDQRLHFLHRRHRAEQVPLAVSRLRKAGISNISVDLMYGFPDETLSEWHADIDAMLALGVEHLSAYALSYEEGTPLYKMLQEGRVEELDEELQRQMYYDLKDRLEQAGYEHYEISNFAKYKVGQTRSGMSYRSRHNSSYWNHTPYIGLGAGAHSYEGRHREWNVDDLSKYMESVEKGVIPANGEELDDDTFYNETVMTALRTREGICLNTLSTRYRDYCLHQSQKYVTNGLLCQDGDNMRLTRKGLFVSDMVMSDLML